MLTRWTTVRCVTTTVKRARWRVPTLFAVILAVLFGVAGGAAASRTLTSGQSVSVSVGWYTDHGKWAVQIPLRIAKATDPGVAVDLWLTNGVHATAVVLPRVPLIGANAWLGDRRLFSDQRYGDRIDDTTGRWLMLEYLVQSDSTWTMRLWTDSGKILKSYTGRSPGYARLAAVRLSAVHNAGVPGAQVSIGDLTLHSEAGYDSSDARDAALQLP